MQWQQPATARRSGQRRPEQGTDYTYLLDSLFALGLGTREPVELSHVPQHPALTPSMVALPLIAREAEALLPNRQAAFANGPVHSRVIEDGIGSLAQSRLDDALLDQLARDRAR